jgi:hypothetical protein
MSRYSPGTAMQGSGDEDPAVKNNEAIPAERDGLVANGEEKSSGYSPSLPMAF